MGELHDSRSSLLWNVERRIAENIEGSCSCDKLIKEVEEYVPGLIIDEP